MAAGATYEVIATATGSGSSGSVTFSSINGNYTDIILIADFAYASLGANTGYLNIQVGNGSVDTGTNYSQTELQGNGTTASSSRQSNISSIDCNTAVKTTNRTIVFAHFQNYANTTTYKTTLLRTNDASQKTFAGVALWRSTSAINTIKVYDYFNYSFATTSTFTLYGIKAA